MARRACGSRCAEKFWGTKKAPPGAERGPQFVNTLFTSGINGINGNGFF